MRRIPLASIVAAAVWMARAIAADPPASVPPVLVEPAATPPAAPSSASRGMSPEMATKLASVVTKFAPTPAPDSNSANPPPPAAEPARSAAPDHPQNTIVRLPSYVVEEQKVPRMAERDMRTTKARLELAYKKYPGLRFPFTFLNNAVALEFQADDDAAERAKEMAELYSLYNIRDPSPAPPPAAPPKK